MDSLEVIMSKKKSNRVVVISLLLIFFGLSLTAQYNPHPCTLPGVNCGGSEVSRTGIIYSFEEDTFEYPSVGTSMPFWLAIGNLETRTVDTTYAGPVVANKISGPGNMQGTLAYTISKYTYYNDLIFSQEGIYKVEVSVAGSFKDTVTFRVREEFDFCAEVPNGCSTGGGDAVYPLASNGGIIPVDAIFPISIGVYNRATMQLDTNFFNFGYLNQLSGPGNMYGTLSMYGKKWLTFPDVRFDTEGTYRVELSAAGNIIPDTVTIEVVAATSVKELYNSRLNIYPNPAHDVVNIMVNENDVMDHVLIYNSFGQIISSHQNVGDRLLEISSLPAGVYFVRVFMVGESSPDQGIIIKK